MRRTTLILTTAALLAALMLTGCSKPWNHPDYSGASAKEKFEQDSVDCQVVAGEAHPLDGHKQRALYKACMTDRGWQHDEDHQGIRFETKPR